VPTLIATLLAFIVGYASIAWLLRWLSRTAPSCS
jgi:undecaprenyl-diphosphatase